MIANTSIYPFYKSVWFNVVVNLLIFLLLSYLLPIRYESNDDTILLLISSGKYSGSPDAHLVYMNYLYGLFVSTLYSLYDGWEWYTICLSAIHIISLAVISWRVVNTKIDILWKILSILTLYIIELWIIYYFQYTTTAALCATASIVLFITANKKWHRYLGIFLFTLAALIRLDPAFLVFLICAPMLLLYIFEHYQKRNTIILLSLFIVLPVVAKGIDTLIYNQDAAWKEYTEFNYYRAKITDNPNAANLAEYPQNVDSSTYVMFRNFFPDLKIMDNARVKDTYAIIDNVSFSDKMKNVAPNLARHKDYLIILGVLAVLLFIVLEDKRRKYLILFTTIFTLFLLCYVSLNRWLELRVFLSAVLPFCLVFFYACSSLKRKAVIRITAMVLLVLLVMSIRSFVRYQRRCQEREMKHARGTNAILTKAHTLLDEGEYVVAYSEFPKLETLDPYSMSEFWVDHEFLILTWLSKAPFDKGRLDSYQDLIGRNIICMSERDRLANLPLLKKSILANYGIHVKEQIIAEAEGLYLIRLEQADE